LEKKKKKADKGPIPGRGKKRDKEAAEAVGGPKSKRKANLSSAGAPHRGATPGSKKSRRKGGKSNISVSKIEDSEQTAKGTNGSREKKSAARMGRL